MHPGYMPNPHEVMLKCVRERDVLPFRGVEHSVIRRHRQGKLVMLELKSSDGDQATPIGHPHAHQIRNQPDTQQPQAPGSSSPVRQF